MSARASKPEAPTRQKPRTELALEIARSAVGNLEIAVNQLPREQKAVGLVQLAERATALALAELAVAQARQAFKADTGNETRG